MKKFREILRAFIFLLVLISFFVTNLYAITYKEGIKTETGTIVEIYHIQTKSDSYEILTVNVDNELKEFNGGHHYYKIGDTYTNTQRDIQFKSIIIPIIYAVDLTIIIVLLLSFIYWVFKE